MAQRARRRVPGARPPVPGALGAGAIPDDTCQDTVLHELDPLLGRPFEVERLWQPARVERVVGEREALVEHLLADLPVGVAALLDQTESAEGVVGEVDEQLGERRRLEDCSVRPGLELRGAAGALRLVDSLDGGAGRVDSAEAPGGLLGVPRGAVDRGEGQYARVGHRLGDGNAGRRGERQLGHAAREEAVEVELGGVDRGRRETGLVVGGEGRRLLVEAFDLGEACGRSQAREVRVRRSAVRGLRSPCGERAHALVVDAVARGDAETPVADDLQLEHFVLDQRGLVHLRVGEARQAGALAVHERQGLVTFRRL